MNNIEQSTTPYKYSISNRLDMNKCYNCNSKNLDYLDHESDNSGEYYSSVCLGCGLVVEEYDPR